MPPPTSPVPAIAVSRTPASRLSDFSLETTPFSGVLSDHMVLAEWSDGRWEAPRVVPYAHLPLSPVVSSLQYGLSVFEGLKAQRGPDGRIRLFRPALNARRLARSADRLTLPALPAAVFVESLRALVREDAAWVPACGAGALYIRPIIFSVDESVRVAPPRRACFAIVTFPFGTYYAAPVRAWVAERYVRAWPGGTGDVKTAGNYAGGLAAEREACAAGCDTALWLDGPTRSLAEECGVMNLFAVIGDTVVTPPLAGTILAGVTRDSAIQLLRDLGYRVEERPLPIEEVFAAAGSGALRECFGTGTAATVSPIAEIRYGTRVATPRPDDGPTIATQLKDRLTRVATGIEPDPHGWVDIVE